ncbi:hypothetical protein BJX68DRAFT_93432 [Aspergillus pseudodeflectus]|uniref:F-box domain-containing protein n=1 Tax=Aspergillus pseudodeflectus TaxID=176178 RepID=A0ABR4KD09_9EURO
MPNTPGLLALTVLCNTICADSILNSLHRRDLKSLRITCRALDDIVVEQSHLFQRAYISAAKADLHVLEAISTTPRLASRVTELIWDVSMDLQYIGQSETAIPLARDRDWDATVACTMDEYAKVLCKGEDFRVLLTALPRFPRLRGVVFTDLMSEWAAIPKEETANLYRTSVLPARPGMRSYESPAMREWSRVKVGGLGPARIPWTPEPDAGVYGELQMWAEGFVKRLNVTMSNNEGLSSDDTTPALDISSLRNKHYRGPILAVAAFHAHGRRLNSFAVEAARRGPYNEFCRRVSHVAWLGRHPCFQGLDVRRLGEFTGLIDGFADAFRSVRRLCLCLENRHDEGKESTWRPYVDRLLVSAHELRTLELRMNNCKEDFSEFRLPMLPRLQSLVLDSFSIAREVLSDYLLDWSRRTGLQVLHLVDCRILVPRGTSEMDVLGLFLDMDITTDDDQHPSPVEESDICLNLHIPDDSEASESDSEDPPPSPSPPGTPIPFNDIDFGPEPPSPTFDYNNRETEDPNDPECRPWSTRMWNEHPDAQFAAQDPPAWADFFEQEYWNDWHRFQEAKYDGDYDADTPDIEDELPIPRVRAGLARRFGSAGKESFEFVVPVAALSGGSAGVAWGGDGERGDSRAQGGGGGQLQGSRSGEVMRILIDNFCVEALEGVES